MESLSNEKTRLLNLMEQKPSYSGINTSMKINRGNDDDDDAVYEATVVAHSEDTPSYSILSHYGLLTTKYRKMAFDDLFEEKDMQPNSSLSSNMAWRCLFGYYCIPCIGCCLYHSLNSEVVVPAGNVVRFTNNTNDYIFAKPGVHNIFGPFRKMQGGPLSVTAGEIIHGNRVIVTIPQGMLGYASDKGQPVLLPPGLHSWTSDTLTFMKAFDLDEHVIEVGPYTIVTVDEGYAAITQDNGKQKILEGGKTHLLSHQKWRFEKFITLKIQTDDLERIRAASADNIVMSVNSTVVWRIRDVRVTARLASETMSTSGGSLAADISKLRKDVLKQAIASLASFIGSVNYSDSFHIAAAAQRKLASADVKNIFDAAAELTVEENIPTSTSVDNPLFDTVGMSEAVSHANSITNAYGVEICSINIISANPDDPTLTSSLSSGAVASAAALQAETAARGRAKAMKIEAEAKAVTLQINSEATAKSTLIEADTHAKSTAIRAEADRQAEVLRAEGTKQAEILRAEGSIKAASLLEKSKVAVELERIKQSALCLKTSDKFFFGSEPGYMSNVVMNTNSQSESGVIAALNV